MLYEDINRCVCEITSSPLYTGYSYINKYYDAHAMDYKDCRECEENERVSECSVIIARGTNIELYDAIHEYVIGLTKAVRPIYGHQIYYN